MATVTHLYCYKALLCTPRSPFQGYHKPQKKTQAYTLKKFIFVHASVPHPVYRVGGKQWLILGGGRLTYKNPRSAG
jgi:hypothetical protein